MQFPYRLPPLPQRPLRFRPYPLGVLPRCSYPFPQPRGMSTLPTGQSPLMRQPCLLHLDLAPQVQGQPVLVLLIPLPPLQGLLRRICLPASEVFQ